jgi:hypothetical protein
MYFTKAERDMILTKTFCQALKFAAAAASTKDVRFYLRGVRFEFTEEGLHLVGTNGASLHMVRLALDPMPACAVAATIGNDDTKRILSVFGKDKGEIRIVCIQPADPAQRPEVRFEAGGVVLDATGVEGTYPQWRRIVPPADRPNNPIPTMGAGLLANTLTALVPMIGKSIKDTSALTINAGPETHSTAVAIRPTFTTDPRIVEVLAVVQSFRA